MAPIGPLSSLEGAVATDPLVRLPSNGNIGRLGKPRTSAPAVTLNDHANNRAAREVSFPLSEVLSEAPDAIEVPRTPTSTQRKRRRSAVGIVGGQRMGKLRRVNETIHVAASPSTRVEDDESKTEV
jgi:hypothetical protein